MVINYNKKIKKPSVVRYKVTKKMVDKAFNVSVPFDYEIQIEILKNLIEELEFAEYNVIETRISALMRIYNEIDILKDKLRDNNHKW